MFNRTYHLPISILCFDGEGGDGTPPVTPPTTPPVTPPVTPPANPPANPPATPGEGDKRFSQADLNKILAEDKRKHQERYTQLETSYQELLQNERLTQEERDSLQTRLADVQAAQRTKEQQAEFERKQAEEKYENELQEARQRGDLWENKFKTEKKQRALLDAASIADAFNPAHIVALLAPNTELKDVEGELVPMVNFPDIDEKTGEEIRTLRTPADAVKRMQELPKIHGCLFKSNVVAGVGSGQANVSNAGEVDYTNMSAEEYRKNRDAIKRRMSQ
jgi:hypothetical protein